MQNRSKEYQILELLTRSSLLGSLFLSSDKLSSSLVSITMLLTSSDLLMSLIKTKTSVLMHSSKSLLLILSLCYFQLYLNQWCSLSITVENLTCKVSSKTQSNHIITEIFQIFSDSFVDLLRLNS